MDGRTTWTDCDKTGDYVVHNVLGPRDLVSRPDKMDETVPNTDYPIRLPLSHQVSFKYAVFQTSEKGNWLLKRPSLHEILSKM